MIPLSTIISELESGVSVNSEDVTAGDSEHGVLKVSCVSDGHFYAQENKRVIPGELHRLVCSVRRGDLLVTRANTFDLIGASGLVDRDYPNLFLPDKVWRVVLKQGGRDSIDWLKHVLNSPQVRAELKKRATGTSGSMKNIPQSSFLAINVFRPLPDEQHRIACILDIWDRGIRKLTDLIAAKLGFKQGLMQQLLTGKRRFPGFTREWPSVPIGSFLTESRTPGTHGAEARKLTVKLYGKGVIPKSATRAGSEATKYYRRKAGQFIYSKLDFLNGAFGIVPAELDGYESTLDLPAFDIGASADPDWFRYYVIREAFYKNLHGLANGGRKARRVNPDDLLKVNIPCPTKAEQQRIADVLKAADREIDLLRRELDALKQQKKGLMQKLLTGQVRVRTNHEENHHVKP